jgi:hypothetical protein
VSGVDTICTLTARRLKPGAYEAFRKSWDPGERSDDPALQRWKRIYHVRDVSDPDVVISFGLFEGSEAELREIQAAMGRDDQLEAVASHVQEVLLDGAYEVIEEIDPARLPR